MRRQKQHFGLLVLTTLLVWALSFVHHPQASASPPGTMPFGIFHSIKVLFHNLSGYTQLTSGYTNNKVFTNSQYGGGFGGPRGVAVDGVNNVMYVADSGNARILKINTATGAIIGAVGNLAASTGTCPASGAATGWCTGGTFTTGGMDGGFNNPTDMKFDATNDLLYIVDTGNHRIVKMTASTGAFIGAMGNSTADGSGGTCPSTSWCTGGVFVSSSSTSGFVTPVAVEINNTADYIYVTDAGYRIIRRNLSTGAHSGMMAMTTAVNSGTAASCSNTWCPLGQYRSWNQTSGDSGFRTPSALLADVEGDVLYIADNTTNKITKRTLSTGAFIGAIGVTTNSTGTCPASGAAPGWCTKGSFTSSTSDGGFSAPYALTLDKANDLLYVSSGSRISKITASTGAFIGNIGYSGATTGTCPAKDAASGWCTGGTMSSGSLDGMYANVKGLAVDTTNGALYATDTDNNRVAKVTASTGAYVGAMGFATLSNNRWERNASPIAGPIDGAFVNASGAAIDNANGLLNVADKTGHRVVKVNAKTGAVVGAIGYSGHSNGTCPKGQSASGWCTGGIFASGSGDGAFNNPSAVTVDPVGDALYISDSSNHRIVKVTASTGAFVGSIGYSASSTGTCPTAAVVSGGWCTGGVFQSSDVNGGFSGPAGLAIAPGGTYLYVSDSSNSRVVRITASNGGFSGAIGNSDLPGCAATGPVPSWCINGHFVAGSEDGSFNGPQGIAIDEAGDRLYVADMNNARIVRVEASTGENRGSIGKTNATAGDCPNAGVATGWCNGGTFTFASVDGAFSAPIGVAVAPGVDALYVADYGSHRISKFKMSTGAFQGTIGYVQSSTGNCKAGGPTSKWCKGGTFMNSNVIGGFTMPAGITVNSRGKTLYIPSSDKVIRVTQ